jgi:hypothetical protein
MDTAPSPYSRESYPDSEDLRTRHIAEDREETEPCERGTDGCSINHTFEYRVYGYTFESECETW